MSESKAKVKIFGIDVTNLQSLSINSIPSIAFLVIANLIPLAGVLFWNWEVAEILILYWSESAIVGFFTVIKMILAKGSRLDPENKIDQEAITQGFGPQAEGCMKYFLIPFFVVHFGGFMTGHAIFLSIFFNAYGEGGASLSNMIAMIQTVFPAFLALFFSHLFSFVVNYLVKKEYERANVQTLMFQPYKRIMAMHFAIVLGGFFLIALDGPTGILLVLVLAKIIMDLKGHVGERGKFGR